MSVEITFKNYRCFPDEEPATIRIQEGGSTAFLGANNSGKSSLLKFFYEFRSLFSLLSNFSSEGRNLFTGNHVGFKFSDSITDDDEVFCNKNRRPLNLEFTFLNIDPERDIKRLIATVNRGTRSCQFEAYLADNKPLGLEGSKIDGENVVVRGARYSLRHAIQVFRDLSQTIYIESFRNIINVGGQTNHYDIAVGQSFVGAWRKYKTGPNKKNNMAAIRLSEDIRNIFQFDTLEINPAEDNKTLQVFIDGNPYKLPEVGSGIAQFIIVLTNAAIKNPSYILIDEPELNLHPSLQIKFLDILHTYARKGVVFATHNIGLARTCEQIYSFRTIAHGKSKVSNYEDTPRLSEFLGELSFSSYIELGYNKILLVEGVTDIKTMRQFLRIYKKDHKVVPLHLGGRGMINAKREDELQEIKRISENIFVIIDSERKAKGNPLSTEREGFRKVCEGAGIPCHVLEYRATENYLSDRAVKAFKGEKYQALEPYQDRSAASLVWSKSENWRIAREMTLEELDSTDLGEFLNSL